MELSDIGFTYIFNRPSLDSIMSYSTCVFTDLLNPCCTMLSLFTCMQQSLNNFLLRPYTMDDRVWAGLQWLNTQILLTSSVPTLFGSLRMRYFPSLSLKHLSMIQRSIPHALSMFRLIWAANSLGLNCWEPRITCLEESRGFTRETYL